MARPGVAAAETKTARSPSTGTGRRVLAGKGPGSGAFGIFHGLGVDHDIIGKSGAWYSYEGAKIAQGRESAKQFLMDNPEVAHEIEAKIKAKITGVEVEAKPSASSPVTEEKTGKKKKS